jgi:heme oxygenase
MDFAPLRRMPPLERDMAFFYGQDWRNSLPRPSAATRKYVDRINEVAASDKPELLLGHVYSRYLGDLFGGQMMMGMATRSLKLERGDDGGLAFYTFAGIGDTRAFIDEWYTALNALDLTAEQKEAIVEEANVVFRLNIEVFNELEGNPARAAAMLAIQYARERIASLFSKDPKP